MTATQTGATAAPTREPEQPTAWQALRQRLESPVAPYYLLLGATVLLVVLGLVMVLSASSVTSYGKSGSSYAVFQNQAVYAVLGLVAAVVASRMSTTALKRMALPVYVVAVLLQLAVFSPLGITVGGNRNWLGFGGFSMQPSEFGKLALVLVGALTLTRKRKVIGQLGHALIPFLPMAAVILVLVLAGHDVGTGLVLLLICATIPFVAGVRMRLFGFAAAVMAAGLVVLVRSSSNRMDRIDAWLGTCADVSSAKCYQKTHALYAMADGSWWGVGLGASREKWFWLPEAHNDFIFAIIGEELGLPGTLVVLGLYLAIGYACYRIIVASQDFFVRLVTAGIMIWIVGQALINIGSVTGLLPIIGVPLPLVSAGGSALVTTLLALGIVISFARNDPAARQALSARPGLVSRSLAVVPQLSSRKERRR